MSHIPKPFSVMQVYRLYRENKLIVNRKYQRKLVWSISEKQELIRSLLNEYPIPLILLAQHEGVPPDAYELIDGMQRLNAICAFLENEFGVDNHYFDVTKNDRTGRESEKGTFKPIDDKPKLSEEKCTRLIEYQIPVSIFRTKSESDVTDVFRRINSNGRHLSPQETRQAGVLGPFPDLVRRLAARIRGDTTASDNISLSTMPKISIDSPRSKLGYGIHASETFWVKLGILNTKQLRESKDEELLADMVISVLDGKPLAASCEKFDRVYDPKSTLHTDINRKLCRQGEENVETTFTQVISIIEDHLPKEPNSFRNTVRPQNSSGNPCMTEFYAVFHACYRLMSEEQLSPTSPEDFTAALRSLSDDIAKKQSRYKTSDNRNIHISVAEARLRKAMSKIEPSALSHGPGLYKDIENSLRRSGVETPRYEFKQGILRLHGKRPVCDSTLKELPKTLASIANLGPQNDSSGYLYFGVSDSHTDAKRAATLYNIEPQKISERYVVGIDREAEFLGESLESYVDRFEQAINNAPLEDEFKKDVLMSMDVPDLRGMHLIRFKVPASDRPVYFDEKLFVRENSSVKEVRGSEQAVVWKRFPG